MVGHKAPRVNDEIVTLFECPKEFKKLNRLLGVGEDLLTPRETVVQMVQPALNDDSRPSRHRSTSLEWRLPKIVGIV
jgi:hypothetical protein